MKQSKTDSVLSHLRLGYAIDSWQSIHLYKLTRLSAVIFNLKKRGYNITTEMVDGDGCRFARYRLIGNDNG